VLEEPLDPDLYYPSGRRRPHPRGQKRVRKKAQEDDDWKPRKSGTRRKPPATDLNKPRSRDKDSATLPGATPSAPAKQSEQTARAPKRRAHFSADPEARMRSSEGYEMTRSEFDRQYRPEERRYHPGGATGGRFEIIATGIMWEYIPTIGAEPRKRSRKQQGDAQSQDVARPTGTTQLSSSAASPAMALTCNASENSQVKIPSAKESGFVPTPRTEEELSAVWAKPQNLA
jgi:hypothetical protein